MFHKLFFLGFSLFAGSCHNLRDDGVWYRSEDVRRGFSFLVDIKGFEGGVFWNDGRGFYLNLDEKGRLQFKNKLMVMVSFNSVDGRELELLADERTLAFHFPDKQGRGFALLALDSSAERDTLALALPEILGQHHCGAMEVLDLSRPLVTTAAALTPPVYTETVKLDAVAELISQAQTSKIKATISSLEDQGTRFHASSAGIAATALMEELFNASLGDDASAYEVTQVGHSGTSQKSLVVRLAGTDDPDTTVVVGAHLDSIHSADNADAPGADDDASGLAVLVEVARVLAANGVRFKRSVEFHAYAAEEVGLVGSKDIAGNYAEAGRTIAAMLQLDMTAYSRATAAETIYLVTTDTNVNLRRALKDLLHTYLGGDFMEKALTAGTSDHRSWTNNGYPTVFPFEDPAAYNTALHTADDTLSTINNLGLATRFAKMTVAFLAHYAGLQSAATAYEDNAPESALTADIALAVIDAENTGQYHAALATPAAVSGAELCLVSSLAAAGCSSERQVLSKLGTRNGRNIFYVDEAQTYKAGQFLRLFTYDADDQQLAARSVALLAK